MANQNTNLPLSTDLDDEFGTLVLYPHGIPSIENLMNELRVLKVFVVRWQQKLPFEAPPIHALLITKHHHLNQDSDNRHHICVRVCNNIQDWKAKSASAVVHVYSNLDDPRLGYEDHTVLHKDSEELDPRIVELRDLAALNNLGKLLLK